MSKPTDFGRKFILARLSDCQDLDSLRRVWDSIALAYQRDPVILKAKDDLKQAMKDG